MKRAHAHTVGHQEQVRACNERKKKQPQERTSYQIGMGCGSSSTWFAQMEVGLHAATNEPMHLAYLTAGR